MTTKPVHQGIHPLPAPKPKPKPVGHKPAKPKPPTPIHSILSVAGYGAVVLHVTALTYGMKIISTESQSKFAKALYISAVTKDSFGLSLAFPTHAEYERMGKFIQDYGRLAASGSAPPARVQIPAYNFDRMGIPSGAGLGDAVGTAVYIMDIGFIGARDLIGPLTKSNSDLSYTSQVTDVQAVYFYPGGTQLTGSQYGADTLYDIPPSVFENDASTLPAGDTLGTAVDTPVGTGNRLKVGMQ